MSLTVLRDLTPRERTLQTKRYIHYKFIQLAKEKVLDRGKLISEIAHEMGFRHPSHFNRLFKKYVGQTPKDYRLMN